jgi:hypothetical protein
MLWKTLQLVIFVGVAGWVAKENPDIGGPAAAVFGLAAALVTTVIVGSAIDLYRRLQARGSRGQESHPQGE